MTYTKSKANQMLAALDADFSDQRHARVLALFTLTGVADRQQIYQATGLTRYEFDTLLHHFRELAGDAILHKVSQSVPRPGVPGRPPVLYTLGPAGAALARGLGHRRVRSCQIREPKGLAHARAIVSVALVAQEAGLQVEVEQELSYADGQRIRPDLLITLPSGTQALFEIEQDAGYHTLELKTETQARRAAFLQSDVAVDISPVIRTLFNLTPGQTWETTVATWERANANVANLLEEALPYEHVALPLADFLASPDWEDTPDPQRWTALVDPAQEDAFGLAPAGEAQSELPASSENADPTSLAAPLKSLSVRHSRLVMRAYVQHLQTHGVPEAGAGAPLLPSPEFFALWQVIYAPSHPPNPTPYEQASHPRASLFLLKTYLHLHPDLRKALSKTVVRGSSAIRWSASLILHRLQTVINLFLRYHGYCVSEALRVRPIPPWHRSGRSDFGVRVKINAELLLLEGEDGLLPTQDEVYTAERALGWVLWALLAYADDLDLKQARFW